MNEETTVLANISRAKQALVEARNLTDILEIHSQAIAVEAYATAKGADEAAQLAVEIKLRSERKAGQFIKDMKEADLLAKNQYESAPVNMTATVKPTLKSLGVEENESRRWQRIASIPDERFEDYLIGAKKRTQATLLQAAAQIISEEIKKFNENFPLPQGKYQSIIIDPLGLWKK